MTYTDTPRNSSTFTNQSKTGIAYTWNEATFSWDDASGTWDTPTSSYNKSARETTVFTDQSKS
jgi:hypothetical protein